MGSPPACGLQLTTNNCIVLSTPGLHDQPSPPARLTCEGHYEPLRISTASAKALGYQMSYTGHTHTHKFKKKNSDAVPPALGVLN